MTLEEIAKRVRNCKKCPLYKTRNRVVPGEGNPKAKIMFVGEAPGLQEDLQGRPFVGAAGKFLDELLASCSLKRKEVFIGNLLKCRPPANRDPKPEEIETCWPYLVEQIKIIKPKLIVTLGRHALQKFLPKGSISQKHGQVMRRKIPNLGKIIFYATFHPAAVLYRGDLRQTLEKDFKKIPKVLEKVKNLKDK